MYVVIVYLAYLQDATGQGPTVPNATMLSPIPRAPKRVSSLQTLPSQESNTGTGTGRGGVTIPRGRGRGLPPKPGGVTLTRSATTSEETSLEPATPSSPKQRKGLPPQPQRTSLARNLSCPDPDPNLPRPSRQTGDIPAITPPPSKSRTRCNYNTSPLPTHNNIEAAPVVDTQTSDSLAWLTGALGASTVQEQQASPAVSNPSSPAISTPPSPITSTSGTPAHDLSWLVAEEASSAPPSLEWLASDLSSPPNTQRIAAEPGLDGSSPMDWLSPEPERVSEPVPPEASSASLDWLAPPPPQQTGLDGDTGAVDNWWEASTPSPDTPAPADNWWESDPNLNSTKTLSLQNPEPSAEFGESNAAEVPGELLTSKSKPLPTPPSSRAYNRNSRPRSVARLQVRLNIPTPEGSPDSSTVMLKVTLTQAFL